MKRRLACILLAALLLLGLCCTAFAEAPAATEAQLWNITDTVGLLTSDEDLTLEARAEEISAQYGVGIYLLILEDYSEYYDDPYETAYELTTKTRWAGRRPGRRDPADEHVRPEICHVLLWAEGGIRL